MNNLKIKHGSEGPRHDPYGFTEITFRGQRGSIKFHYGLATWCEGERNGRKFRVNEDANECLRLFEEITTMTPMRAESIAFELPWRKHAAKCDGRKFFCSDGYPGERFTICKKCDDVVDYHFDRSAVE